MLFRSIKINTGDMKLHWLLSLLLFLGVVFPSEGFLTSHGVRGLIHLARKEYHSSSSREQGQQLELSRMSYGRQDRVKEKEEESSIEQVDSASSSSSTTIRYEDPNFIPGEYIDAEGQARFVTPPPVTDVLVGFVAKMGEREEVLWRQVVSIVFDLVFFVVFLLLCLAALAIVLPLQARTRDMKQGVELSLLRTHRRKKR